TRPLKGPRGTARARSIAWVPGSIRYRTRDPFQVTASHTLPKPTAGYANPGPGIVETGRPVAGLTSMMCAGPKVAVLTQTDPAPAVIRSPRTFVMVAWSDRGSSRANHWPVINHTAPSAAAMSCTQHRALRGRSPRLVVARTSLVAGSMRTTEDWLSICR